MAHDHEVYEKAKAIVDKFWPEAGTKDGRSEMHSLVGTFVRSHIQQAMALEFERLRTENARLQDVVLSALDNLHHDDIVMARGVLSGRQHTASANRRAREFAWSQYKRGAQDTVDALRAGIAGMGETSVPKLDILKFCEFTEQRHCEKLPPDFPATAQ